MWVWYWFWIIQNIIISTVFIYCIHCLITYLKDTFTVKKTKDVVGFHIQKYKSIMNELQDQKEREKQELLQKIENKDLLIELTDSDLEIMNADISDLIDKHLSI